VQLFRVLAVSGFVFHFPAAFLSLTPDDAEVLERRVRTVHG